MKLNRKDLKKIKSLHVISKININIYDENFSLLKSYKHNTYKMPSYGTSFKHETDTYNIKFHYGIFHEIFISVYYKSNIIIIGPISTHIQSEAYYNNIMIKKFQLKNTFDDNKVYWDYYNSIPVYSLGDIRDFIIMLGFLFDLDLENKYSSHLHEQVYKNQLSLREKNSIPEKRYASFQKEKYSFYYENKIMELVAKGSIEELKEGISHIGCSVIPSPSNDCLRAEKNYTIVILEKLCSLAIQIGKDVSDSIELRDFYVDRVEKQQTLINVLSVRDSAIIHFTKELHEYSIKNHSPAITAALQYIHLNIYSPIKVKELARHVFMSESALRNHFKRELGLNVTEYIMKRKISEAKLALKSGMSVSDVSEQMGFYDNSHFHKAFKNHTGMSPVEFQKTVQLFTDS